MLSLDSYNSNAACAPCDVPQKHSLSHDDLCPVCIDDNVECDVVIMPCFHSFHGSCILNWVERNFSCPMCRAEVENFVPVKGQTLEPRFTELWDEHFLEAPEEPPVEETKKGDDMMLNKTASVEEVVITLPLDEELDTEEIALLLEEPLLKKKEKEATMPSESFEPVVFSRTFQPQYLVLTTPDLASLAVPFINAVGHSSSPVVIRLPNMTVSGALVLHTLAQQNYQIPHQLKRTHARSHMHTKMQALNRVQRRTMSTRNFTPNRVKPIRMDLAFRLPSAPRGPVSIPPQPVLRQQAKGNAVNTSKQVLRKVHKLAILATRV